MRYLCSDNEEMVLCSAELGVPSRISLRKEVRRGLEWASYGSIMLYPGYSKVVVKADEPLPSCSEKVSGNPDNPVESAWEDCLDEKWEMYSNLLAEKCVSHLCAGVLW